MTRIRLLSAVFILAILCGVLRADWRDAYVANSPITTHNAVVIAAAGVSTATAVDVSRSVYQSVWYTIAGSGLSVVLDILTSPDGTNYTLPSGGGATVTITASGAGWFDVQVPYARNMQPRFTNNGASSITVTAKLGFE